MFHTKTLAFIFIPHPINYVARGVGGIKLLRRLNAMSGTALTHEMLINQEHTANKRAGDGAFLSSLQLRE
jgi:hypothetical protein